MKIDDFINSEHQVGDYESSGAFTLDLDRSVHLRANYTLERPELWVLKYLQSMTRFHASCVSIQQTRSTLTFRARLQVSTFREFPLLELFQLPDGSDDPRVPLREALWGSMEQGRKVTIAWWHNTIPQAYTFGDKGATKCAPPSHFKPDEFYFSVHSPETKSVLKSVLGFNPFAKETKELIKAGATLPFRLTLNKKSQDPIACLRAGYGRDFEVRFQRTKVGPRFRLTQGHESVSYGQSIKEPLLKPGDEFRYFMVLSLDPQKPQVPTVTWMLDGVGIQTENLTDQANPLALRLYLPGQDLTTDITGLSLRQNPDKADRLQKITLEALIELASQLPLALIATLPKKFNRRLELLNLTHEMRELLDRCAVTIGAYGGHQGTILGSLGAHLSKSEERLQAALRDLDARDAGVSLDVPTLRNLSSIIAI